MMNKNNDKAMSASKPISHMAFPLFRYVTPATRIASAAALVLLAGCVTDNSNLAPVTSANVPPRAIAPPAVAIAPAPAPTAARPNFVSVPFDSLDGWHDDDMAQAWPAFLQSCRALFAKADWRGVCSQARALPADNGGLQRHFFETQFIAYHLVTSDGVDTGTVTGYYEPLLQGSVSPRAPYLTPIYGVPDDLLTIDLADVYPELKGLRLRGRLDGKRVVAYPSRAELDQSGALIGKELVWVNDAIEAFFLQIQGSGRVEVHDPAGNVTQTLRLSYADQNGQPYRSIGRWLVDRGEMTLDQASMQSIQAWAKAHPARLQELLDANPSYVFFKSSVVTDPTVGPMGALGVALTPMRSLAVDARVVPLGAPVFLATTQPNSAEPLRQLMFAQDTGGAIFTASGKAVRADFFWGFGAAAGEQAGRMKQQGRMWVLLPRGMTPPHS